MSLSLSDLPVNQFTASELVRLCLRHHDAASVDDNSDIDNEDVVDADDEVVSHQLLNSSAEFLTIHILPPLPSLPFTFTTVSTLSVLSGVFSWYVDCYILYGKTACMLSFLCFMITVQQLIQSNLITSNLEPVSTVLSSNQQYT